MDELGMAEANPQRLERWEPELEIRRVETHLSALSKGEVCVWGCRASRKWLSVTSRIMTWLQLKVS